MYRRYHFRVAVEKAEAKKLCKKNMREAEKNENELMRQKYAPFLPLHFKTTSR